MIAKDNADTEEKCEWALLALWNTTGKKSVLAEPDRKLETFFLNVMIQVRHTQTQWRGWYIYYFDKTKVSVVNLNEIASYHVTIKHFLYSTLWLSGQSSFLVSDNVWALHWVKRREAMSPTHHPLYADTCSLGGREWRIYTTHCQ